MSASKEVLDIEKIRMDIEAIRVNTNGIVAETGKARPKTAIIPPSLAQGLPWPSLPQSSDAVQRSDKTDEFCQFPPVFDKPPCFYLSHS